MEESVYAIVLIIGCSAILLITGCFIGISIVRDEEKKRESKRCEIEYQKINNYNKMFGL